MKILGLALKNYQFTLTAFILLLILGTSSFLTMPRSEDPPLDIPGASIIMNAGYEGKAKGAGAGGTYIAYEIVSQHQGVAGSEACILSEWSFLTDENLGDCNF